MKDIKDLELCKNIAKILAKVFNKKQGCFVNEVINYNPVEDWNLTGLLMVKYRINLNMESSNVTFTKYGESLPQLVVIDFIEGGEQRAILEAIILKEGL
jgi:hypothetical protein